MDYRLDPDAFTATLEALDRRRWLFEQLPVDPVHLEWFRHRAWVRTVHGTTKIEGNTLSEVEVEELLAGTYPRVSRKEALEVLGSRDAIQFVDDIAVRTEVPIDEAVVRETHRRVLGDIDAMLTPGEYRRGENRVIGADGQTIFTTPPSGDVPERMRAFGAWLREGADGLPAPLAAAVAHLEFVAIHPFNDGNATSGSADSFRSTDNSTMSETPTSLRSPSPRDADTPRPTMRRRSWSTSSGLPSARPTMLWPGCGAWARSCWRFDVRSCPGTCPLRCSMGSLMRGSMAPSGRRTMPRSLAGIGQQPRGILASRRASDIWSRTVPHALVAIRWQKPCPASPPSRKPDRQSAC